MENDNMEGTPMKKNQSLLALALCLAALMPLLTACSSNPLLGTWKLVNAEGSDMNGFEAGAIEMVSVLGGSVNMIFTKDEITLRAEMFGVVEDQSMPYTVQGNTIRSGSNVMSYQIKNDILTLSQGDSRLMLQRVGK